MTRNPKGQQDRLARRLTAVQQARRQERIHYRSTTRTMVERSMRTILEWKSRSLLGRLKWVCFGR